MRLKFHSLTFFIILMCSLLATTAQSEPRTIRADVAAFDQIFVYNRFGSFNPYGMMFALKRDLVAVDSSTLQSQATSDCADDIGIGTTPSDAMLMPGNVRLRDCKRPRPMVLRANVGDTLEVRIENLLRKPVPGISETWCKPELTGAPYEKAVNDNTLELCREAKAELAAEEPDAAAGGQSKPDGNWPATRGISFVITGLVPLPELGTGIPNKVCVGLGSIAPGEPAVTCRWRVEREGTHFISSFAAPSGGEGDGGSLTHGLFGALIVEQKESQWYRSQMSSAAFDLMWPPSSTSTAQHARAALPNYQATTVVNGTATPVVNMVMEKDGALEIVHSDLNAIIAPPSGKSFREFTVVFHDELKTFYPDAYKELGEYGQLAGVRDGFGINYGASGMGTMLLANRKKIGPTANCAECLYEEFFLQSWANGDPALLENYADDPSNVHHSYMNDAIVFRNFHAGPKETHVFHLHAHQWFGGNDGGRGSYLDSQTVAPQQGFSYNIYHGGLDKFSNPDGTSNFKGWWESLGSGNRNRTVGDSIFHCHLYPHFAQGMWELWRNHDVLEDGTRKLPDGQAAPGLSLAPSANTMARSGTVTASGEFVANAEGTPVPAIVPIPNFALPVLPTYGAQGMPGYPFFVAGEPGHRAPQAPLDIAVKNSEVKPVKSADYLDGGLPRHVMLKGSEVAFDAKTLPAMLALGDFTGHLKKAKIRLLPYGGTDLEKRAMAFHHNGAGLNVLKADGTPAPYDRTGYQSIPGVASGQSLFTVNGAPPKPGAPFADPCGAPDGMIAADGTGEPVYRRGDGETLGQSPRSFKKERDKLVESGSQFVPDPAMSAFRRYEASAIQLTLVTNRAGWHDPQARINVLSKNADAIKGEVKADQKPFFFRARSGECIEFRHTNELPKDLELDDFQVRTPTDTIGQHIHLVKFDVTASDGSGNGWNYEDGTFAADEIAARICASEPSAGGVREGQSADDSLIVRVNGRSCADVLAGTKSDYYKTKGADKDKFMQTTVQRWFADPILSCVEDGDLKVTSPAGSIPEQKACGSPKKNLVDRTMRTVFTHDHFGPSSIQQHGFYSALLVEPQGSFFCNDGDPASGTPGTCETPVNAPYPLYDGGTYSVGDRKIIVRAGNQAIHPDYREYALAIADFATLYDPNGKTTLETDRESVKGLDRLVLEAKSPASCDQKNDVGGGETERVPANCAWGSAAPTPKETERIAALAEHAALIRRTHGSPVAAPRRPESISVDHHDPYLVNYKHEPVPLRIGSDKPNGPNPFRNTGCDTTAISPVSEKSIKHQLPGSAGDFANVFRSAVHGDPCTPLLEMYTGEKLMVRLIQGAQEVQHMFTVEGFAWRRSPDQKFPADSHQLETTQSGTWNGKCLARNRKGNAVEYLSWLENGPQAGSNPAYWQNMEKEIAACNNVEGFATSQEIGISEHFEFGQKIRGESSGALLAPDLSTPDAPASPTTDTDSVRPTDYLYHFGTHDAVWNGAWGLIRVFNSLRSADLTTCLREGKTADQCAAQTKAIGNRVYRVEDFETAAPNTSVSEQDMCQRDLGLGPEECVGNPVTLEKPGSATVAPKPHIEVNCPAGAPSLRAYVAAVRASDLKPGRVYYDEHKKIYDPNGVVLVQLDRISALSARRPGGFSQSQIIAAARQSAGNRVDPLVLRANAGDCIDIQVINALRETTGGGLNDTHRGDDDADAPMPKIVPLNVSADEEDGSTNARPSASLALSMPLSSRTSHQLNSYNYGANHGQAIPPATATLAKGELLEFYAGRISFQGGVLDKIVVVPGWCAALPGLALERIDPVYGPATSSDALVHVYGRAYRAARTDAATISGLQQAGSTQQKSLRQCLESKLYTYDSQEKKLVLHAIPYAFGPIPIKPLGDFFGQLTHGLFGTVIIEPKDAEYAGRVPIQDVPKTFHLSRAGGKTTSEISVLDENATRRVIKEMVVFYQDGLNLWDKYGFRRKGHGLETDVKGDMPIKDCPICDDTYDFGEKGASLRSSPFFARLRHGSDPLQAHRDVDVQDNLNEIEFPPNFFTKRWHDFETPTFTARPGDEIMFRVIHPGGRARQRAFVPVGFDYDDLFPGFGFPHSALLAPGKALSAIATAPMTAGCYMWRDGPNKIWASGVWGMLDVHAANAPSSCSRY